MFGNIAGSSYQPGYSTGYSGPAFYQCEATQTCDPNTSSYLQPIGAASVFGTVQGNPFSFAGSFGTLAATSADLPITYPTLIGSALVNPLLKSINSPYLLGHPLADVITPALKILVNIGYTDVLTPEMLNTTDENNLLQGTFAEEGFRAYDQTSLEATPFAWFNNPALTPKQTMQAYADAWTAFTDALKAQAQKPLWGFLVPNPDNPPAGAATPAATTVTAAQTVSPKPAAATTAVELAPTVSALAATAVSAPPAAPVTAPVADDPNPIAPALIPDAPAANKPVAVKAVADEEPAVPAASPRRGAANSGSNDNSGSTGHRGRVAN